MVMMNARPAATPSALSNGWHPAYLLHISEEATPQDWQMHAQSPTMYRWHFVVWEDPGCMSQEPELQSGLTSTKFSPKGRYPASKAYTWSCALLGRTIQRGETIDFDPLCPVPCRIRTVREPGKDFVKVLDVESWVEGAQTLTPLKDALLGLRAHVIQERSVTQQAPPGPPLGAPVPPGLQTWGSVQAQGTIPARPTW